MGRFCIILTKPGYSQPLLILILTLSLLIPATVVNDSASLKSHSFLKHFIQWRLFHRNKQKRKEKPQFCSINTIRAGTVNRSITTLSGVILSLDWTADGALLCVYPHTQTLTKKSWRAVCVWQSDGLIPNTFKGFPHRHHPHLSTQRRRHHAKNQCKGSWEP